MQAKLLLVLNTPYILTQNIDKRDKLVNGSFGHLRYIEFDDKDPTRVQRLWIEFTNASSGRIRRIETQYHASTLKIGTNCTPIARRSAPINLGSTRIKVKRTQFPIVAANALTVHKSQGGTYDKVVFEYSKNLQTSLVYVGLSRATTLSGLYLTNEQNEHIFHHCSENANYAELKTEFKRLENVSLNTVLDKAINFFETDIDKLNFCYMNVQSLYSHNSDIVRDDAIQNSDILALSETWLDDEKNDVPIEGYKCITRYKRSAIRAGGVAIYESNKSTLLQCHRVDFDELHSVKGDVCCARMLTSNKIQFCVVTIYASCGTSLVDLEKLFDVALWRFNKNMKHLRISQDNNLSECPVILCGDLNINMFSPEGQKLLEYAKQNHDVELLTNKIVTTRNNTCIDYVFTKGISVDILPYVSYFSTHRPMLCKIKHN